MGSKVGLGDIRGLLIDSDKRPVLRLLPQMDEVSRGYAIAHLGGDGCSIEDIANQVWILNTTDWIRGLDYIPWILCKNLDYSGFDGALHEFAVKVAEDFLVSHEKREGEALKESWDLLELKRKWMEREISDKELEKARAADLAAFWDAYGVADRAAYWAADRAAEEAAYKTISWAVHRAEYRDVEKKKQLELLGDILEDSVGIQGGVEGKSLESKVLEGGS